MSNRTPLRISIAGLGTVGCGLIDLLENSARRATRELTFEIVGVSARNRSRQRAVSVEAYRWEDDPVALATARDTDVFVELIGGADGPAKVAVEAALSSGIPVVTANKALIAEHGTALAALAEEKGVALMYEAAVAGGTPVVRGIREGTAACSVSSVHGILNGTCNYILSTVAETGAAFEDVLLDAQRKGFAEADPSFDVDGIDAAHKLSILATLAFDAAVQLSSISVKGIRDVTADDVSAAQSVGLVMKLMAEAVLRDGALALRVVPALIPQANAFAKAQGSENVISVDADPLGRLSFQGPGAGAGATAAAVAADLCTLARGAAQGPVFAAPADMLRALPVLDPLELENPYFLRMELTDTPGAMASISSVLAGCGMSIETLTQTPRDDNTVVLVLRSHPCTARAASEVPNKLRADKLLVRPPSIYPIITP